MDGKFARSTCLRSTAFPAEKGTYPRGEGFRSDCPTRTWSSIQTCRRQLHFMAPPKR